jgi:ribosomal protein S18 acetylase RimI-like enzyme
VTSFRVDVLAEDDWPRLRDIRLKALNTDPTAFLASHENEAAFAEQQWRQEFARGEWHVMRAAGQGPGRRDVGLLGVTRLPGMPMQECYLEYMWVAPGFRRRRMASILLRTVLHRLRNSGVRTVWLYILDGNDGAMQLYKRFGFQRTNERQELPGHPAGSEEKMQLRLT